jgi:signal transduction histidine kinase
MRLGVSAKIFLAYAVLLSVFAANAGFTLLYLHRGRQELAANQRRLEVQVAVDAALRALEDFSQARATDAGASRLTSRLAAQNGIASARQDLRDAVDAVDQYLRQERNPPRREEFEDYRRELVDLDGRIVNVAAGLGASESNDGERDGHRAERSLANLLSTFHRLKSSLRGRGKQIAEELSENERRAVDSALVLTGLGLLLAVGAALWMLRTLWPLRVLRERTRQIAGGDYAHRTGVRSRDEIGDLAREFDAMAHAIEEREQKLIRSERLATVGRMAAHITHEIRNPLASVGLYVELLVDEVGDNAEAHRLLGSIGAEVDRLSEITETYLRFVRLPKPKLEHEDLGAIATSVLEFARGELALAGVKLEIDIASGLPEVAADESQIRQALLNLVRNAKEAMPEGGQLRVALVLEAGARWLRLTIADSGPGIAAEDLPKIFDPFFSTKEKGTGLGLALVQQIVSEHGGRIEVDMPPSGGTQFAIVLPALRGAESPSAAESRASDGDGAPGLGAAGDVLR